MQIRLEGRLAGRSSRRTTGVDSGPAPVRVIANRLQTNDGCVPMWRSRVG